MVQRGAHTLWKHWRVASGEQEGAAEATRERDFMLPDRLRWCQSARVPRRGKETKEKESVFVCAQLRVRVPYFFAKVILRLCCAVILNPCSASSACAAWCVSTNSTNATPFPPMTRASVKPGCCWNSMDRAMSFA